MLLGLLQAVARRLLLVLHEVLLLLELLLAVAAVVRPAGMGCHAGCCSCGLVRWRLLDWFLGPASTRASALWSCCPGLAHALLLAAAVAAAAAH